MPEQPIRPKPRPVLTRRLSDQMSDMVLGESETQNNQPVLSPNIQKSLGTPEKVSVEKIENYVETVNQTKDPLQAVLYASMLTSEKEPDESGYRPTELNLDENDEEQRRTIYSFFKNALGSLIGEDYDPRDKAWCAAFVDATLTKIGADRLDSWSRIRANDYTKYGVEVNIEDIRPGDIVIFDWSKDGKRDGRGDHVTFYAGDLVDGVTSRTDSIRVLGGNQGDRRAIIGTDQYGNPDRNKQGVVSVKNYSKEDILAVRRITRESKPWERIKDQNPLFFYSNKTNPSYGFDKGGDVAAQMDLMLPSADEDTRSTKEFLQHPLETVPYFQRPMGSSTDDPQVGQDDAGNPVFKGSLGEYTVRVNPDQRTLRTKVEEAIPVVKEAVGDYLEDPKLPTKDQLSEFAKQAGQSAVESVEDLGDLMFKGKGTLGDVFAVAAGAGAASVPFDVPKGALRIFGGVNAEGAYEDKNLKKAVRLLREADVDPTNVQESYFKNKKIWEQTGWYVDPKDGQWRFEIDDSKSKLKDFKNVFNTKLEPTSPAIDPKKSKNFFNEIGNVELSKEDGKYRKLNEVFDHEDFYRRYPDLKDIDVIFYSDPKKRTLLGSASDDEIFINLSAYDNYEDIKSTLLHELQHVVQHEEGFVPGSSTSQVPQSLIEDKTKELEEKKRPLTVKQAVIKNKQKLLSDRIKEEKEEHSKKPLPNITKKQQIEIFKLKPFNSNKNDYDGPSWASIARDYKVTPAEIKKAYGREMLLVNLAKEEKSLALLDYRIAADLFEIEDENFNIEMEFYKGAGGEIESRLVQRRADLSGDERGLQNIAGGFPLDDRVDMLKEEGGKFQYTGSAGVDPYAYQISPRVEPDPEKPGFLSGVKKKLGLTSDSAVDRPKAANSPDKPKIISFTKKKEDKELKDFNKNLISSISEQASKQAKLVGELQEAGIYGDYQRGVRVQSRNYKGEALPPYTITGLSLNKVKLNSPNLKRTEDRLGIKFEYIEKDGDYYLPMLSVEQADGGKSQVYLDALKQRNTPIMDGPKDFNKGGAVMNEQMEMAFMQQGGLKDDGMKRDPVSGNKVPNGSMAKEVRDDIPAQLSEGEYVVPADVVRYLGVKHFEDLRDKAKNGLQKMEATGRIGGEPVPVGGPKAMQQPQQMQPPMPQAPTPYSPPPAPMPPQPRQMAMGGDLSPEEMQEINNIMMNQGGMVAGAANGADFSFYKPPEGVSVEEAITTPGRPGGGRYTGEFSFEQPPAPITTAPTPPPVVVETPATCEARGMVYNPETKLCEMPLPVARTDEDDGGEDEGEDSTTWMDNYNYTDFETLAQQTSAALDGPTTMLGSAAEFIFGGGVLGKFAKASNAAQVAANIAILEAQGKDVDALKVKFNTYVNSNGLDKLKPFITGSQLAKQINSTQVDAGLFKDSTDVFGNKIFKTDKDWEKQLEKNAPEGMTYDPTVTTPVDHDDDDGTPPVIVTGGYTRPGSAAPDSSPRPKPKPSGGSSSSSSNSGSGSSSLAPSTSNTTASTAPPSKPKPSGGGDKDPKPSASSGFGGMGADPAESFGGSPTYTKSTSGTSAQKERESSQYGALNKGGLMLKKKRKK